MAFPSPTHLGQVWSLLLGGQAGHKLTLERAGKEFTVVANVQHFLGAVPEKEKSKGKSNHG